MKYTEDQVHSLMALWLVMGVCLGLLLGMVLL